MTGSSRRIYVYWLLLLVPTLAVGAGALMLLEREQARLDEQARAAVETKRAAIEARARLIAENVELLVGDVQSGLMTTLNQVPADDPDAFFGAWGGGNPLVRSTFRLAGDDRILRPASGGARNWLTAWIASGVPWREQKRQEKESDDQLRLRKDTTSNVVQMQNARSSLNELAQQGVAYDQAKKAVASAPASARVAAERTGWVPWRGTDGLHLIGWRQPAFGGVLGVEVNLATISARLGELLPREGEFVDAFAVREGGVTVQTKFYAREDRLFTSRGDYSEPIVTIPIATNLLPGWEVVGYARGSGVARGAGGGFFLAGSLLVGIFVVAILAGGSLLLWQARRSEAEAAQKTSFVANVSHEFKTPLTTIRLYSELLEQGRVRDEAQGNDYLRTIGRETQRLARLVNNALDFSRLEQGKKKFALESLDLTAELARLLDTHAPRVAEAGLKLNRDLPASALAVTTDRDAIEQIVLNLIDNACKYADGGEVVLVSLAPRAGTGVEIRVADRGPGVPAEHRERIFEKFHRVDDALTAEKSGAGLGLSIARQLARGLGGELRYAPREGGGAEFILELP